MLYETTFQLNLETGVKYDIIKDGRLSMKAKPIFKTYNVYKKHGHRV